MQNIPPGEGEMLAAEMSTMMFTMAIVTLLFTASYLTEFYDIEVVEAEEDEKDV